MDGTPLREQTSLRTAFLPGFGCDIFISYAHVDNIPDRPDVETQGWVDRFEQRLQALVWKRLGERVKVWRDRGELKKSDDIDPALRAAIDGSAFYVVLISHRYLRSESCRNEVQWIEARCGNDRRLLAEGRVFPVLLYDIAPEQRPSICQGKVGFEFHVASRAGEHGRPLDPERDVARFSEVLDGLANELVERLRTARSQAPKTAEERPVASPFKVFLTATPGQRIGQRKRLGAQLASQGIEVVDASVPPPYEVNRHAETVRRIVREVDLSIHLLDEQAGPPIEGEASRCFPEEQCLLAHQQGGPQLIVLPEYFDLDAVEVPTHRALLENLSRGVWPDKSVTQRLTVARAREDEAIFELIREQRDKKLRALALQAHAAGGRVLVDLNTKDLHAVAPLIEFLEKHDLEPITIPSSKGSPGEYRALFAENIARAVALIIVYGEVSLDWLKARAQNGYQLIIEKELPIRPIVYALPPQKSLKDLQFLHCPVVDCTAGFNEDGLASAVAGGRS